MAGNPRWAGVCFMRKESRCRKKSRGPASLPKTGACQRSHRLGEGERHRAPSSPAGGGADTTGGGSRPLRNLRSPA